ncbi:MAG: class II aldolase/adducin family protein [Rhodocyclaceae bacterium]|nr:class II aldolase/adducin family protein [Rhodocyclaceae bacterium]
MTQIDLREGIVETVRALTTHNLNRGTAGNVSARWNEGFLVTPTGLGCNEMQPGDVVPMAMDGNWEGARKPSSEWRFHRDIYAARPEAGAVVHANAPFATALACLRADIPPFHYMIARFGGPTVRCAAYATFGTQALSDAALAALEGRCACLLANHGMLAFGRDLRQALDLAVEFESLCEQYWRALQVGRPVLLPDAEMEIVLEKFRTYGQQ